MILIPVALILLDLLVMVITNSVNDSAAKNAARAAANQAKGFDAHLAAEKALKSFHPNAIMPDLSLQDFVYDDKGATVKVVTRMKVNLPVPCPGYEHLTFDAQAVEPIVGNENQ